MHDVDGESSEDLQKFELSYMQRNSVNQIDCLVFVNKNLCDSHLTWIPKRLQFPFNIPNWIPVPRLQEWFKMIRLTYPAGKESATGRAGQLLLLGVAAKVLAQLNKGL